MEKYIVGNALVIIGSEIEVMCMQIKKLVGKLKEFDFSKLQRLLREDRDSSMNRRWEIEKAEIRAMEIMDRAWLKE